MTITVNGVDLNPYIAHQGVKWSRNDIEGSNAGMNIEGTTITDRIASKMRLDITLRPLKAAELRTVLEAIYPEHVTVTYDDPLLGRRTSVTMRSNNSPASYMVKHGNDEWWGGVTFPLVEL